MSGKPNRNPKILAAKAKDMRRLAKKGVTWTEASDFIATKYNCAGMSGSAWRVVKMELGLPMDLSRNPKILEAKKKDMRRLAKKGVTWTEANNFIASKYNCPGMSGSSWRNVKAEMGITIDGRKKKVAKEDKTKAKRKAKVRRPSIPKEAAVGRGIDTAISPTKLNRMIGNEQEIKNAVAVIFRMMLASEWENLSFDLASRSIECQAKRTMLLDS